MMRSPYHPVGAMARRASDGGANIQLFVQQWFPGGGADQANTAQVTPGFSQMNKQNHYSQQPAQAFTPTTTAPAAAAFGDPTGMFPHSQQHTSMSFSDCRHLNSNSSYQTMSASSSYHSSTQLTEDDDEDDNEAIKR